MLDKVQCIHKPMFSFNCFPGPKKVKAQNKGKIKTKISFKLSNGRKILFSSMVYLKPETKFSYCVSFHSVINDRL